VPVKLADNRIVYSEGFGTVVFKPVINGKPSQAVEFTRVLHVPDLRNNLLAVLYLTRHKNINVHITSKSMEFCRNDKVLFTATINEQNMGYLDGQTVDKMESVYMTSTLPLDLSLWHRRLGHHNYEGIKKLVNHKMVHGLVLEQKGNPDPICEPCLAGKMHANPFSLSNNHASEPLELIHTDVHYVGTQSRSGYLYWVTFIDDAARFYTVIPLKAKSDVFSAFKRFKAFAENLLGRKIKAIRDDKGGEYMSNAFNEFTDECGIIRQHTVPNRPQQNGVAERANRTLAEGITAMLNDSGLPKNFWEYCLGAFVHTWNRCPSSALDNKTPYEIWFKKKPDIGHIRVWGCIAYVHVQKEKRSSLGSHMEKCIFIGYPEGYKGWRFYNPITKKVIISERAEFDERYTWSNPPPKPLDTEIISKETPRPSDGGYIPGPVIPVMENEDNPVAAEEDNVPEENNAPEIPEEEVNTPEVDNNADLEDNRPIALRKGVRNRQPPKDWWAVREPTPIISDSDDEEEAGVEEVNAAINSEPQSYAEAMKTPEAEQWRQAALEEINAHMENQTWKIVKLPPGKKAIGSKWVFKVKRKADGSIERFKARVVAKGFNQRPGFDYTETFAPTMRYATLRLVLALAAAEGLHLRSVDISHAFINSEIDIEIYMKQPEGFHQGDPNEVCELGKGLYGLKQASRLWSLKLRTALEALGFKRIYSDSSVYIYQCGDIKVIIPVFVDDITLASKCTKSLDRFVKELATHFKLKDLGPTSFLLGIEITRDWKKQTISLLQRQYIQNKLEEFGMADCYAVGTPMDPGVCLSLEQSPKTIAEKMEMEKVPYMNAVGSLMYLATTTRPDIAYTAGVLARFCSNPGIAHWKAVKHLLRYLKGTINLKLTYGPDLEISDMFVGYSDANFGGDKGNGKSTTGYIIKVGSGAVSWSSKLQPIVALSTTEAEYVSAVATGKEICWMQNLLQELGYRPPMPSKLFMDNQSAMTVAKNPEHHGRMKHLDLCYYWLRDMVEKEAIDPIYLKTNDMPADILTKALPKPKVERFRVMLGLGG
jgi:transposase InsO family protein